MTALWVYEGAPRKLILKLKYKFVSDIAECLATVAADLLKNWRQTLLTAPKWYKDPFSIVPIPLHWTRENWRGFNHAEELAKILAGLMNWQVVPLLVRGKRTKPQVGLKEEERKNNVAGIFEINSEYYSLMPSSCSLILFDDVWTTGATMKEACRVLKKAGFKNVWCLTLAR